MNKREKTRHTPGPWKVIPSIHGRKYRCVQIGEDEAYTTLEMLPGDARLIAAAPELLSEARVLRCLASSPRFQRMTVAEALSELATNGCGHDEGAAIAKAEGDS